MKPTLLLILISLLLIADVTVVGQEVEIVTVDSQYTRNANVKNAVLDAEHYLFVSTLDGKFISVNPVNGNTRWVMQEEPVLRVPVVVQSGFTFLPNPQDGSLYVLVKGKVKKLPFTIPQLVAASPCKSSDGVLYAGTKKDSWLAIDPITGRRLETLSHDSTNDAFCPASSNKAMYIGRTQYSISMFDEKSRIKRWNATFMDYSSHIMPSDTSYTMQHYGVCSDGRMVTVDRQTGNILWEKQFNDTVVAVYVLQNNALHRIPYAVMGKTTYDTVLLEGMNSENRVHAGNEIGTWLKQFVPGFGDDDASYDQDPSNQHRLHRTLYVGESQNGLYALPSYVDDTTVTIVDRELGYPLLEGPHPVEIVNDANAEPNFNIHRPHVNVEPTLDGHHERPQPIDHRLIHMGGPINPFATVTRPQIEYEHEEREEDKGGATRTIPADQPITLETLIVQFWQENRVTVVGTMVALIATMFIGSYLCLHVVQSSVSAVVSRHPSNQSASTSRPRTSSNRRSLLNWLTSIAQPPDGWQSIGQIHFDPSQVLGRGCEGTVVYRGEFDNRPVAVKRVVTEFVELADREVSLLRDADNHSNVIRYYCMANDAQFRYIALELCSVSLQDYVDREEIRSGCPLSSVQILYQATDGLAHLHKLKIVHRDIKPQNVLLSQPSQTSGVVRALISDFGLCKRIQVGRNSLSTRSGLAGTQGWMAPEIINQTNSVTCQADIFSLGCVYYYVMTGGVHPFGYSLTRQANIVKNDFSLGQLKNKEEFTAVELIDKMLHAKADLRPPSTAILKHPLFWAKDKQLAFFTDVSDRVEKDEPNSLIVQRLEYRPREVLNHNWHQTICLALQTDLRKFRTYRGNSVRDLLRAMRNKKHHYRELDKAVQESLGVIPGEFVDYFTKRFPRLLNHVYHAVESNRTEPLLSPYYSTSFDFAPDEMPTTSRVTVIPRSSNPKIAQPPTIAENTADCDAVPNGDEDLSDGPPGLKLSENEETVEKPPKPNHKKKHRGAKRGKKTAESDRNWRFDSQKGEDLELDLRSEEMEKGEPEVEKTSDD